MESTMAKAATRENEIPGRNSENGIEKLLGLSLGGGGNAIFLHLPGCQLLWGFKTGSGYGYA